MAVPKITGIAETVKILKTLDNELVKQSRKDLRTGAQPVANAIKANIPTESPLQGKAGSTSPTRGMIHNGRTGWNPSGISAKVKTNFSKKAERRGNPLVSIVVGGKGNSGSGSAAFQISDMAGRSARGKTASGRAMIRKLNASKKASRYVYPAAQREIPYVRDQLVGTIRKLTKTYNDSLKKV
jgi:hypothetical protein